MEADGCPAGGQRPGEKDIVAEVAGGNDIERYSPSPPIISIEGTVRDLAIYTGQGAERIKDISSLNDLLLRLWKEYEKKCQASLNIGNATCCYSLIKPSMPFTKTFYLCE